MSGRMAGPATDFREAYFKVAAERDRLKAVNADLLAVLIEAERDIRECLVTSGWPETNIAKDPRLLRYKAAIAKAKGESA